MRDAVALRWPATPLTDGVVLLDAFAYDDARDVPPLIDDEIVRWLPVPDPYSEADAREWIRSQRQDAADGRLLTFAVRVKDSLAGSIGLRLDGREGEGEIGYWIAADARGHGSAPRAIRLLAAYAFDTLTLARIELLVHPDNAASRQAAKHAGAQFEGIRRAALPDPALARAGRRPDPTMQLDGCVYSLLPRDLA